MKPFSLSTLCLAALCAAAAPTRANDILVYKISSLSNYNAHGVYFPNTAGEEGSPAFSGKLGGARYAVIDLNTPAGEDEQMPGTIQYFDLETILYPAVDASGNPVRSKKRFFTSVSPEALSGSFDRPQPLKTKDNFLWNRLEGAILGEAGTGDIYESGGHSLQLTGVATPLVVSKTLTIPKVPRTLAGREVFFGHSYFAPSEEDPDPSVLVISAVETSTWTLDTTLTKAANTAAVTGTADLDSLSAEPDYRGTLSAGTLQNGVQRVRNLLYATGYRLGGELAP